MGEAVIFNGRSANRRRPEESPCSDLDDLLETLIARLQSGKPCRAGLPAADAELIARARKAAKAAARTVSDLNARIEVLQHLAVTDELTGLLNRRGFCLELGRALARAQRYGDEGALIYIDIDAFKPINDRYGHAAGDEVLRHVAQLLNASVRCTDHVGRLGGDEFAVLLSRATAGGGHKRAAHLSQRLKGTEVLFDGNIIPVYASVGIQIYGRGHCLDADALIDSADRAMYAEKGWRRLIHEPRGLALAG